MLLSEVLETLDGAQRAAHLAVIAARGKKEHVDASVLAMRIGRLQWRARLDRAAALRLAEALGGGEGEGSEG